MVPVRLHTPLSVASSFSVGPALRRHYFRRTPEPAPPEVAELLTAYAQHTPRPLTLGTLLSFGQPLTPQSVLTSVSYAQAEIPRRLATRIRSLEGLPFIVGTNPYIARILDGFRRSFLTLASYPSVTTLEENAAFVEQLDALVHNHANDIPTIAKGFQECVRYMTPEQISNFVDAAIRNRIAVRLIAEQHVALTYGLRNHHQHLGHIGIIDMACSPMELLQTCGSFVSELCEATLGATTSIVIDGHVDATFAYVPVHLEYILTEILKNAFRATVEHHLKQHGPSYSGNVPPITVTIVRPCRTPGLASPPMLTLRIRDQGGGVSPAILGRIFSYSFTTAGRDNAHSDDSGGPYAAQHVGGSAAVGSDAGGPGEANLFGEITAKGVQAGMGTIAGLGFGLPMSRLYARYFGGSLDLYSLDGWGSDILLKMRCLDAAEDLEI
ncbi:alpha-ketoacid dehydrogenase kinase [Dentipellis sp. KUC8613]|nr:alpha-ketoacid dehydrogenase kinase [Dentipellis sp. KUC8613]